MCTPRSFLLHPSLSLAAPLASSSVWILPAGRSLISSTHLHLPLPAITMGPYSEPPEADGYIYPFSPLTMGNLETQNTQEPGPALSGGSQLGDTTSFFLFAYPAFPPAPPPRPSVMLPGFALPNKVIACKTSASGSFFFFKMRLKLPD